MLELTIPIGQREARQARRVAAMNPVLGPAALARLMRRANRAWAAARGCGRGTGDGLKTRVLEGAMGPGELVGRSMTFGYTVTGRPDVLRFEVSRDAVEMVLSALRNAGLEVSQDEFTTAARTFGAVRVVVTPAILSDMGEG
jgi:hypothetical protein